MAASCWGRRLLIILWIAMECGTSLSLQTKLPLCPNECKCKGSRVDCSRRNLRVFPKGIPSNATSIDLSNNLISQVDIKELSRFSRLKSLVLHHNILQTLPPWFKFPNTLSQLSLHHNKIAVLPAMTNNSTHGINLKKLVLSHNSISRIEKDAFLGINPSTLQVLKLNRNSLAAVPTQALERFEKLRYLDLTRNNIHTLHPFMLAGLLSLKTLRLSKNRIARIQLLAFAHRYNKLRVLYLDHNNFSSIELTPLFGLVELQQLYLNDNKIVEIKTSGPNHWASCCPLISTLDLARNNMRHITSSTFSELHFVDNLNLSGNRISNIAGNAFAQQKLLQNLDLSNNHITWSSLEGNSGTFSELTDLQTLRLDHNRITTIAREAFKGLDKIVSMNLSANIISSIQEDAFVNMKYLTKLYLDTKNLLCDCKLKWLPKWVAERRMRDTVKGTCLRPRNLAGKSVFNVSANNFVCDSGHPAPKILLNPRPLQKVVEGTNVTLRCIVSVVAKNDSRLTLGWKRNSLSQHSPRVINTGVSENPNGIKVFPNELRLIQVTRKDEGYYQCIARNEFGEETSKRAQLSVLVRPRLDKLPKDYTVNVGKEARFTCAATGHPEPKIFWRKDGGGKFVAAVERRIRHVHPHDYVISNAKAEDMGDYTCFAQNEAGSVNATATLTVLETPRFIGEMKKKTAKVGGSVVFECIASGSPAPTFVWLKDNKILNETARFISTSTGQLCIIVRVQRKDAGVYACRVSNTLGAVTQRAHLTVIDDGVGPGATINGGNSKQDEKTYLAIIVIVVVVCVIGTSIVWLIVIFCSRRSDRTRKLKKPFLGESEEAVLAGVPRDDISYIQLKSSSSGNTQESRDSPRSTATFLTSGESQGASAFPRSTSGLKVASSCDKESSGDNSSSENSPKDSHSSLNSSCTSDSKCHLDQRIAVQAQVHSSSDSDSERQVSRTSSPRRKKNLKGAKNTEEIIPLNETHTNMCEDKSRCKIATMDGIFEEGDEACEILFRSSYKNYEVGDSNSTDSNSSV